MKERALAAWLEAATQVAVVAAAMEATAEIARRQTIPAAAKATRAVVAAAEAATVRVVAQAAEAKVLADTAAVVEAATVRVVAMVLLVAIKTVAAVAAVTVAAAQAEMRRGEPVALRLAALEVFREPAALAAKASALSSTWRREESHEGISDF